MEFNFYFLLIPANTCILEINGSDSIVCDCLGALPAACDAKPSLIDFFLETEKDSFKVANVFLTSLTVVALSKALIALIF